MNPAQHASLPSEATASNRPVARWYFDVVSPFSYLHLAQFDRLHAAIEIELGPVLFAGLLRRWESKGPAELPTKRIHAYRYCTWVASRLRIPFRMPPRHPFNPLPTQRLLVALGAGRSVVARTFDFIYGRGRDPELDWMNAFIHHPGMFDIGEMRRASQIEFGAQRKA